MTNRIPFQNSLEHILAVLENTANKNSPERLEALKSIGNLTSKYMQAIHNAEERINSETGYDKRYEEFYTQLESTIDSLDLDENEKFKRFRETDREW